MANSRQTIRAAVMSLLSGQTSAGLNVYSNRETKLWESELPAILIYTLHETNLLESMNRQRYVRTLLLAIKVKVESSTTVDDDLDSIVAEVETIIANNPSLSGTVLGAIQMSTEVIVDSTGQEDIATAVITVECKYIS